LKIWANSKFTYFIAISAGELMKINRAVDFAIFRFFEILGDFIYWFFKLGSPWNIYFPPKRRGGTVHGLIRKGSHRSLSLEGCFLDS
jgi:hypothetical protein